ncbi:thiosulfate ABC transporter substrate-binding protein CysP [Blochmannia endosymbiont of Camponotus sp. C-003]|uniref:thiosulfate ABC transporter substrate-binding protein CysP n=1 Tax=unclassified Candidatus Blochmanniella TaxID=711328 RepID=UPI0020244C55|nr:MULTISPECIES: thiosulfate ABC transporter substrate-binding protein CysP [unclassified Candidatus Blochmannia]URJ23323.1 thiosulfate ABC transporter substrate-binding protein CysP [Blochmannia endosymbiont of Camponotus sp. C-003]URJ28796.1 thiosulfate ABC transporter substrate-binding protein CysP [Blochmannia endosymbiont of Camponotus sp. C-046]
MKLIVLLCCVFYVPVHGTVLLNSSYDVSRELFLKINSDFIKYWKDLHPEDTLIIRQSHAGSTRQAMAILQGLRADVVTYNQVIDIQILCDRGHLIPKNWQDRFPNHSSPFFSTMAFLVRRGNPKGIHNWHDLTNEGLQIIFPNPKTSGNGRYTYLAAWNFFLKNSDGNIEQTRIWMQKFLKNVVVFDTGGRAATSTFVDRNQGDVLISFESEAKLVQDQYGFDSYEIVIPTPNILVEFPVTWIDKNVIRNKTKDVAQAYLDYLYVPAAQKIITKLGYRVNPNDIDQVYQNGSSGSQLFRIEDQLGNWKTIMNTHFTRGGELDQLLSIGHR